ncbi:hypothetical protein OHA21_22060 [Actinoplanes sp. NBC_00393]|uniref:hypothetical protein n=1 Tax=Actinoplanes sp. NBC_00393 TaxID=2975953 RepID=UPI002E251FFA
MRSRLRARTLGSADHPRRRDRRRGSDYARRDRRVGLDDARLRWRVGTPDNLRGYGSVSAPQHPRPLVAGAVPRLGLGRTGLAGRAVLGGLRLPGSLVTSTGVPGSPSAGPGDPLVRVDSAGTGVLRSSPFVLPGSELVGTRATRRLCRSGRDRGGIPGLAARRGRTVQGALVLPALTVPAPSRRDRAAVLRESSGCAAVLRESSGCAAVLREPRSRAIVRREAGGRAAVRAALATFKFRVVAVLTVGAGLVVGVGLGRDLGTPGHRPVVAAE